MTSRRVDSTSGTPRQNRSTPATLAQTAPPMAPPADAPPNYTAIKAKQQQTWAAGDYAVIGSTLNIVGEMLAEAMEKQGNFSIEKG